MLIFWVEVVLLAYFLYVALYTLIFSIAGRLYKKASISSKNHNHNRFAVLIPAYKEDGVICSVAEDALQQDYPQDSYDIIVIADSLQDATLHKLRNLPIKVVEVSFEKSTKVKALNQAMAKFKNQYDMAVILDADNLMKKDFLKTINNIHLQGHLAIQGRRAAKNKNNSLSLLDGLSEEINNHILGKGSTALGLSSALKGSGMSFNYELLRKKLANMVSIGGFDRELEVRLVDLGIKVYYAHNAVVFDEKVEKTEVFENQRRRWIYSQYHYLAKYFFKGLAKLFQGNFAYFNSSLLRNIQLPRLINIGLIMILLTLSIIFNNLLAFGYPTWLTITLVFYLGVMLTIPKEYFGKPLVIAILKIPSIFINMFFILFKLKGANKKFIHTPHTTSEVSDN